MFLKNIFCNAFLEFKNFRLKFTWNVALLIFILQPNYRWLMCNQNLFVINSYQSFAIFHIFLTRTSWRQRNIYLRFSPQTADTFCSNVLLQCHFTQELIISCDFLATFPREKRSYVFSDNFMSQKISKSIAHDENEKKFTCLTWFFPLHLLNHDERLNIGIKNSRRNTTQNFGKWCLRSRSYSHR